MTLVIRPAMSADAHQMCDLLNGIIALGGTTAHEDPFDAPGMQAHYIAPDHHISTMIADLDGDVVGFQMLVWPDPALGQMPEGWGFIGSFVKVGQTGLGIGKHLFAATCPAARLVGCRHIDATIRADNVPGRRYYSGLGFREYDRHLAVPLKSGRLVDRVRTRFDL